MKLLIKPIANISLLIVLFLTLFVVGINRLNKIRGTIASNKKLEESLIKKFTVLQAVDEKIGENITLIDIVLPSRGGVLYALNQIKSQSAAFGLTVSALSSSGETMFDDGIIKNSINFDIDGDVSNVYSFLQSISRSLPVMKVINVDLKSTTGVSRANVALDVYSAKLPEKIPSVTGQVSGLTDQELSLLDELLKYKLPEFIEPKPSNPTIKDDPFSSS